MRVGVFHPPFHVKHYGGSVVVTIPIINELVEKGFEVILFVNDKINQKKISEMLGEPISPLAKTIVKPTRLEPRSLLDLYECAFKLLVLKKKCDVIIDTFSNYIFPWSNVCYIHFPYINTYRFKKHLPYLKKGKGLLSDTVNLPYVFFAKNAQRYHQKLIIANSYFTSKAIKETIKAEVKVLYPPVSPIFFQNEINIPKKEERENLVITIGRITEDKKMETIPKIANMVREANLNFIIIGFAHSKEAMKKLNVKISALNLENKIKILTDISRIEIKRILERAKVYLHPPIIEHFGIAIAEAMALGCIPIVFDEGGPKEFVPKEFRYKSLKEAAEKVEKGIYQWSSKYAGKMKLIVQRFAEPNFRKNFIKMFQEYLEHSYE